MTPERFTEIFDQTVTACRDLLITKGNEYTRSNDRLRQFRIAAALRRETPEEALAGMMVKHTTSVYDFISDLERNVVQSLDKWDEKIFDSINYLILLRALIIERAEREEL